MNLKPLILFLQLFILLTPGLIYAEEGPHIETFVPQGIVKGIRQVSVRFSEQMVPFGDPRGLTEPFAINCTEKGTERWADQKNWIYDFDKNLPAGIRCEFNMKSELKSLSGKPIIGNKNFVFSTGGPAIMSSMPFEGSNIDEEQIFILELDAEPTDESITSNVSFSIEGIHELVGIRILSEEERRPILETQYRYKGNKGSDKKLLVIQAKQRFPADTKVGLIWGKGVTSKTSVANEQDQKLRFRTRSTFTAYFHCQKESKEADCIPISSMYISFSAPVSWDQARKIELRSSDGKNWKAGPGGRISENEEGEEDENEEIGEEKDKKKFVHSVIFKAPFPQGTDFKIEVPPGLIDDAGRRLSNADKYPLAVRTDEYPPLAKFPARFGILELKGDPLLPVTLRNIEPEILAKIMKVGNGKEAISEKMKGILEGLKGKIFKVQPEKKDKNINGVYHWLKSMANYWEHTNRDKSVFGSLGKSFEGKHFSIPKPNGAKAFEVVGIPMKEPGFYVVEIESLILGSSLLAADRPIYVPTSVLVTNLSVHFKWGRESSLAWVTTLDDAKPVKDADVEVRDCKGNILYQGQTDTNGIVRILSLPSKRDAPHCSGETLDNGLFITAELGDDLTFVHSNWVDGIEPWRFQLPEGSYQGPTIGHTIFDRSLLRAGETLHMKHVIRNHTMHGFSQLEDTSMPKAVMINHYGSGQKYEFPLSWDKDGIAETTWEIPRNAKLGEYVVLLMKEQGKRSDEQAGGEERHFYRRLDGWRSGSFRVEEFRVPLMKAIIKPPSKALILPKEVTLDLAVKYLSGGGASNIPVKLKSQLQPGWARSFEGFEGFSFNMDRIKEGISRQGEYRDYADEENEPESRQKIETMEVVLDKSGAARTSIANLPTITRPMSLLAELEFKDPNGEVQTASSRIPIYHSKWSIGIKPDSWALSKDSFKFHVGVVELSGKPVANASITVDLLERKFYSHRKRLIGGFYAYEHLTEVKRIDTLCTGKTDKMGLLICEVKSPVSGNVILLAKTIDNSGIEISTHRDVWVGGKDEWWFDVQDNDRIDLIPEKKHYEPGEVAKLQVRMPFREATALITVEREGVNKPIVKQLSGKMPVIEIPIEGRFAPNIYISVLVVRGRVADVQPTAMVDLGRPAYKLGIAEINVGWKGHELKVKVSPDRDVYRVREKAKIMVEVKTADGKIPPPDSEIAIAAVDEGLLELMPNNSWELLGAIMGRRGYEVNTSTAQMHVVGKRHFGLKALPSGGGGGRQTTRELFDTLLLWKGRVKLNEKGRAEVDIPLNDSITSFRIVAVATGGVGLFGTGSASIRSTQDLMILSGVAPLVREGDRFNTEFTLRNSTDRTMDINVSGRLIEVKQELKTISLSLSPGEAREINYDISAPIGIDAITYEVEAREKGGIGDKIKIKQKVIPAVPVRTYQATIVQIDKDYKVTVKQPDYAIPGRGGININLQTTLSNGLAGVIEYMNLYPYICLEQKVSKAIALRDNETWKRIMDELPNYLDSDGLVKYFPTMIYGSDVLTSYIIAISHEAGWDIPESSEQRMADGLIRFVEGKIIRGTSLPTADLSIRKIGALEALSRIHKINPFLLTSISVEPNPWPTSAVIDWFSILKRVNEIPNREKRLKEAEQVLRSRLNFQGTIMGFSTEDTDRMWWLMVSNDLNAVKFLLAIMDLEQWREDIPRLVRGTLARQYKGAWNLTLANAWGVLTIEKFSSIFEKIPVSGITSAKLELKSKDHEWEDSSKKASFMFPWPSQKDELSINHNGEGKPWATIQSLAAIPLKEPFSSGYKIKRQLIPVEQKNPGRWTRGDIVRVRLEIEAQADMTWVVVTDPIPAGATILGSGLGRDSNFATKGEKNIGWVWPAFEERSFEGFRSYYEFVPKGSFTVEYTVRLNQSGIFELPQTRIEALYSPEMFGEIPNRKMEIQ